MVEICFPFRSIMSKDKSSPWSYPLSYLLWMTTSNSRVTRSPSLVSSFKRFRLKTDGFSEVGRGTQGSVYKAYTKTSPKTAVAIKVKIFWKKILCSTTLIRQVIHKKNLSKKGRDNLVTEIGILKKLKHKFIVDLVDFHWDDKYIYIGNSRQ